MENTSEVYARAFHALLTGPTKEDRADILRMLSDHPDLCTSDVPDETLSILEEFAENKLYTHVLKITKTGNLRAGNTTTNKTKMKETVRLYCELTDIQVSDDQRTNLETFFDTYFGL